MFFKSTPSIYKNYDIRGKYGEELTSEEVTRIGKAIVLLYKPKIVAIGRDIRPSAETLFNALAQAITEMGADVYDLGLCTTPMSYFACGRADVDVSVMITASHMPSEFNGLKIAKEDAKPASKIEMEELRRLVEEQNFRPNAIPGKVRSLHIQDDWIKHFTSSFDFTKDNISLVIDPANMIGGLEIKTFEAFEPNIKTKAIFADFDPSCPNHEANPMKHETLISLSKAVTDTHADIGVAFDGDADRVGFVDEKGDVVPSDIIGAILARFYLKKEPGSKIICDVRSSDALVEEIERLGGIAIREKVGHINIRASMRKHNAVLGIELTGHFFFKDSFFSEGGPLPVFVVLKELRETNSTLSEESNKIVKYYQSREINSTITRSADVIFTELRTTFPAAHFDTLDGLTIREDTWWCNVRNSATDPVMRLNVEAKDPKVMEEKRDLILSIIRS
jgi:phosphomannomutase